MKTVSLIFATGDSWLDCLVTTITRSRWSHVAIRFDPENLLVESLVFRGLIMQAGDKYAAWPGSQAFRFDVDDDAYAQMLGLSRRWGERNVPYGYWTCVAIGLKELFGPAAGRLAAQLLAKDRSSTLVCSEMIVKLWRIGFPDFLPGAEPRLVTPDELFHAFSELCGKKN